MSGTRPLESPSDVTLAVGQGGLQKVLVETPWSRAEIYLHGAHITHFQKIGEEPLLFVSDSSHFTSQKAIRGGVPIIFPWFGGREGLSAHGYARTTLWELIETTTLADGAIHLRFQMPSTGNLKVEYGVTVAETLRMELIVTNLDAEDFSFENCLHTYFQIRAIEVISITGLLGSNYFDKLKDADAFETSSSLGFSGEVDRVYSDTTDVVEIKDLGFGRTIRIEKSGSKSTVVWNPWIEKSKEMADFGDQDYLQMVCVESGNIAKNSVTLAAGQCATLAVEVSSSPLTGSQAGLEFPYP
jgi:glucose-6-phosphate 1-epimerase